MKMKVRMRNLFNSIHGIQLTTHHSTTGLLTNHPFHTIMALAAERISDKTSLLTDTPSTIINFIPMDLTQNSEGLKWMK